MNIYDSIQKRTDGNIYIGVVGPVRTGKSTFIKKFMEALVIPNIKDADKKVRTIDELPQSSTGRTVMTTQPNFIPEQGVEILINGKQNLKVRLVDCVGYMIKGAQGDKENGKPRMVKTPWHKQAIPFEKAAEIGTYKVISEHSTIGFVITTDGSISDIPRENYIPSEERVIYQLKKLNKPFVVILNTTSPNDDKTRKLAKQMSERYAVSVVPINCLELDKTAIETLLTNVLMEFPIKEVCITVPKWLAMQKKDFPLKEQLFQAIKDSFEHLSKISDISKGAEGLLKTPLLTQAELRYIDYGTGAAQLEVTVDKELYYNTLMDITGEDVRDDWALMKLMQKLSLSQKEYEKLMPALQEVERTGYGIVMPGISQLKLEEPEIVKQGTKFGVRLKASAPSLHILRADICTEVSPIVGSESSSEDLVNSMMKKFEENPLEIWQSNIFGNSLQNLVTQGLNTKLSNIPDDARAKLQETIEKVVNEGCQGLICVIL